MRAFCAHPIPNLRDPVDQATKDDIWESEDDRVQASVQISAVSPKEVKRLTRLCRKAIANYIASMSR